MKFEIWLLFFQAVLPVFTTYNLFLQQDDPQIYILHSQMISLLKKLLSKFIKASVIQMHGEELGDVPFENSENHLDISKVFVGLVTRSKLNKKLNEGDVTDRDVKKFYTSVFAFYTTAVSYVLKWFPLHEDVTRDSQFVDFTNKEKCDFSMVCTFVDKYSKLLKFSARELDQVSEEFFDYQAMSKEEIPKEVWDDAVCYEVGEGTNKITYFRMDRIWSHISQMKLPGMDIARFACLFRLLKSYY